MVCAPGLLYLDTLVFLLAICLSNVTIIILVIVVMYILLRSLSYLKVEIFCLPADIHRFIVMSVLF